MNPDQLPKKLRERIRVAEGNSCWIWIGCFHTRGTPVFSCVVDGVRVRKSARRLLLELKLGRGLLPENVAAVDCDDDRCVSPYHLVEVKRGKHIAVAATHGLVLYDAVWLAKLTAAHQRNSKIGIDVVREVRRRVAAGEPQNAVAADLGLTTTNVGKIVTHKSWREPAGALQLLAQQAGML